MLTKREAADIISEELGRPVKAWMVEHAVKQGRLRADKSPGRRGDYLINEEDLRRLVGEIRERRAREAPTDDGPAAGGQASTAWDYLPERPMESFWIGDWKRWRRWSRRD
jgi:hypothetical protein